MKKKILAGIMALTMLTLAACTSAPESSSSESSSSSSESSESSASEESSSSESSESTSSESADGTRTITDREGLSIVVKEDIETIVCMSKTHTETLVALGLGDKIVATDTNSVGVEGISADLPAYSMFDPDAESLAALNPDLVIASGMSTSSGTEDPFKPVKDLGIPMTYIPSSSSIEGIKEDIAFLGELTKTEDKAAEIITTMEAQIAEFEGAVEGNPTVYFEIAAAPDSYSFGTGTFLNEIIEHIGATNVFADVEGWIPVSAEEAVAKNPDYIFTSVNYIDNPVDEILARAGFESVTAVANGNVYYIDTDASTLANENIVQAMEEMVNYINGVTE